MEDSRRQEQWRARHSGLCARFPQLRQSTVEIWPTELDSRLDVIFADQSQPEPERLARAERAALEYSMRSLPDDSPENMVDCVAAAVRRQV